MRLAGPGRLELVAKCDEHQHWHIADPLNSEIEQFARGRINPMRVLEYDQHRPPASQALEPADQRLQCPFLFALWAEVRQWVPLQIGSIQCASSNMISTGRRRAKLSSRPISASSVRSFLRCGLRFGNGCRSELGIDSRSAMNAMSSSGHEPRASKTSSFSSLEAGGSTEANRAARAI